VMYILAPQTRPMEGERATNCFRFEGVNLDIFMVFWGIDTRKDNLKVV